MQEQNHGRSKNGGERGTNRVPPQLGEVLGGSWWLHGPSEPPGRELPRRGRSIPGPGMGMWRWGRSGCAGPSPPSTPRPSHGFPSSLPFDPPTPSQLFISFPRTRRRCHGNAAPAGCARREFTPGSRWESAPCGAALGASPPRGATPWVPSQALIPHPCSRLHPSRQGGLGNAALGWLMAINY